MSHVVDGGRRVRMERLNVRVDVLSRWEFVWHQVRLVVERVVRSVTEVHALDWADHESGIGLQH